MWVWEYVARRMMANATFFALNLCIFVYFSVALHVCSPLGNCVSGWRFRGAWRAMSINKVEREREKERERSRPEKIEAPRIP